MDRTDQLEERINSLEAEVQSLKTAVLKIVKASQKIESDFDYFRENIIKPLDRFIKLAGAKRGKPN